MPNPTKCSTSTSTSRRRSCPTSYPSASVFCLSLPSATATTSILSVRAVNFFNLISLAADVENILNWKETSELDMEVPFKPARVILQDFTGVPAVVDLAAMRTTMQQLGGDPKKINPLCQVDLVIDHSVQVDVAREADAKEQNEAIEFERN